jgi:Immunoglobulin domain/Immunoglobulin I-set domain
MNPIQCLGPGIQLIGFGRFTRMALLLLLITFPAISSNVLFVVGNLTLSTGDAAIKTTLEGMGHIVTTKLAIASATSDAATTNLVLVSTSVTSGDVAAKFKTVAQPVFVFESGIFDDMAMTGLTSGTNFGSATGQTQVVILTAGHQMSAGLTGPQSVSTASATFNWGKTGTGAVNLANIVGDATKLAIFGYEVGSVMVGLNAPGRRVGYYFADNSASTLTTAGTSLFKAAISWALSIVPPTITTQPANLTVALGATATFSVVATGSAPLAYQWRKAGVNIAGATSASYTTPATLSGDNGALFSVVITNSAGSVSSANATLTVTSGLAITTQPASQTVTVGATATFSVVASGTPPLTYQWSKNAVAISGATSASYTTPATVAGDNGALFSVVVTGIGSVTSNNATLTVNTPPSITTQPINQSVTVGATATFSVVASGTPPLTYQWRKNAVAISGATSASYTTPSTVSGDNGALFSVVVTGTGSVTSSNAVLTVNAPPSITTQPVNQTVTLGATVTFSVVAVGTAPLIYQWRKNAVAISGATSASYTTPPTVSEDNGALFSVVVTGIGSVTSTNAILTISILPPTFTLQPTSVTVNENQTATFSVTVSGTEPFTYQWNKGGSAISGATLPSYTTPPTTMLDSNSQFTCTVTNSVGSPTSTAAVLTVKGLPPVLNPVVSNSPVTVGASAVFSITQTGTPPFTYQWQRNAVNISGATSASYTLVSAQNSDNGVGFRCVVTGRGGIATSSASILVVNSIPAAIDKQPDARTVYEGQSATFSVSLTVTTGANYQWQKNSINIAGALDSNYTTPSLLASDSGALYRCIVTHPGGTLTSNAAMVHVRPYSQFPVSQWIGVSAELRDDLGNLIGKGAPVEKDMVVKLFTNLAGGAAVYQEDFSSANGQPISVKNGFFTLYLGSGVANGNLNQILTANPSLFAEVSIGPAGSQETLSPRTPVTAPAYQGAPQILRGSGNPSQQASAGTYYENTDNGSVWLRLPVRWTQVSN